MIQLLQTFLLLIIFIFLCIGTFYAMGFILLVIQKKCLFVEGRQFKGLSDHEIVSLSLTLGTVIFVLTAVGLALLNLRWVILPLIIVINLILIYKFKFNFLRPWKTLTNKTLLFLLVLGILIQGLINFPSGYLYKNGLEFWSSQGHDGLWHVALMEEIKKQLPSQNPTFSGEALVNYHYLVDVLMGEFLRIFPFFSGLDLYFRFFPVLLSFMLGISAFSLVARWQNNLKIGYWAVFFTYFVGSFGYIVTFIKTGNLLGGETVFWAAQQNTLLGNPPHAISHSLLASFLLAFLLFVRHSKREWFLISLLLGLSLAGFKVSGGFVMLAGLAAASLVGLIFYKNILILVLFILLSLSNFITFKSMTTANAESFLMFLPWWFIRTMVVDKLGWMDLELRRQYYLSLGTWKAYLRVVQFETIAFIIFITGNLGMRVLGFYEVSRKFIKKSIWKDPFEIALATTMITGLLVPIFFVQKGIIYNNIQFMQYFLFIFGFYGAIAAYRILDKLRNKILKVIFFVMLVSLSVPTVIGNLNEFYGLEKTSLARISNTELEALRYLNLYSQEDDIILTAPFNKNLQNRFNSQPRPIYAWYSTPYVSAISARRSYLTAEEQALITGYPFKERLDNMNRFFKQDNFPFNQQFLKDAKINYIYLTKAQLEKPLDLVKNNLYAVFENEEVVILKVKNEK